MGVEPVSRLARFATRGVVAAAAVAIAGVFMFAVFASPARAFGEDGLMAASLQAQEGETPATPTTYGATLYDATYPGVYKTQQVQPNTAASADVAERIRIIGGNKYAEADGCFTVSYRNSNGATIQAQDIKNVGDYVVVLKGKDTFRGATTATFTIKPASLAKATVNAPAVTYDGKAKEPAVTVALGEISIPATGYEVAYKDNVNAGTATVTVTGIEAQGYKDSASTTFAIGKAQVASAEASPATYTADGSEKNPAVTVKDSAGKALAAGSKDNGRPAFRHARRHA